MVLALLGASGLAFLLAGIAAWRAGLAGRMATCAWFGYLACSACVAAFASAYAAWPAMASLNLVFDGPSSDLGNTLLCVVFAWLLFGSVLLAAHKGWLSREGRAGHLPFTAAFYLLAFLYLNVLRERIEYGHDVYDYTLAATNLFEHHPLHDRYLYPPLFATLLEPLVPWGPQGMVLACIAANYASLLLFFVLVRRTLVRYGFALNTATVCAFGLLCANVPVLRTLFFVQVNLHVANLVLASLLFYVEGRSTRVLLSALALALAVHVKISPILLALPYLLNKDWKWLLWFAGSLIGITAFTSAINGFEHYREFLVNVANIHGANGVAYRDNSVDSIVSQTWRILGGDPGAAKIPILLARGGILLAGAFLCFRMTRAQTLSSPTGDERTRDGNAARVLDTYPVLLFVMTSVSPLVWEHHPVFVVFPFLVLFKRVANQADAMLYFVAYFAIFIVPTFDVYPFSFHRFVGTAICYVLMFRFSQRSSADGPWFTQANAVLTRFDAARSA